MSRSAPETKQKLIDTALDLIWSSSYGSVSVDDICKTAGIKKGSFYHFFPSKVDLAMEAMEQSYRTLKPSYDTIFSPEKPAIERINAWAEFMIKSQEEAAIKYGHVCGCPCASLGSEMAGQEAGIREKFDEQAYRQKRYFENAVRDLVAEGFLPPDIDISDKAAEMYAYLLGQLTMARIQNNLEPLKRDLKAGLLRTLGVREKRSKTANE